MTRRVSPVEQRLLTFPEHLSSPPVLSGDRVTQSLVLCVCLVDICLSFCPFSFGHCVVGPSSIYGFWLHCFSVWLCAYWVKVIQDKVSYALRQISTLVSDSNTPYFNQNFTHSFKSQHWTTNRSTSIVSGNNIELAKKPYTTTLL